MCPTSPGVVLEEAPRLRWFTSEPRGFSRRGLLLQGIVSLQGIVLAGCFWLHGISWPYHSTGIACVFIADWANCTVRSRHHRLQKADTSIDVKQMMCQRTPRALDALPANAGRHELAVMMCTCQQKLEGMLSITVARFVK